jgi:hypothetical protein
LKKRHETTVLHARVEWIHPGMLTPDAPHLMNVAGNKSGRCDSPGAFPCPIDPKHAQHVGLGWQQMPAVIWREKKQSGALDFVPNC